MKEKCQFAKFFSMMLVVGVWVNACASSPHITIHYQPPGRSDALAGKRVVLDIKDMRSEKDFLSKSAKAYFKHFTGIFLLSLDRGEKEAERIGRFDLPSLLKETFKRRMETMGISVVTLQTQEIPVIEIVLNEFMLDLADRNWVTTIAYKAQLRKGKGYVISETVSGTAERYKFLGRKDAEKALGEIVTDSINRLDIHRLIQQPGL